MYFYKILFINSLMFGTLITISSYSWLSMWMGLEINLLSFIPIMINMKNIFSSETSIKYFISQAMASIILLFSITLMNNFSLMTNSEIVNLMLINSSLFMKMGAAPFHFWFPQVMEGLNWNNSLILLTWQKIAPMIMINYSLKFLNFIILIMIMCALIGSLSGLSQISLRKILSYSSINHMSWMLSAMIYSSTMWIMYFSIYSIISANIIIMFKIMNIFSIKQMFLINNNNISMKMILTLNFLSLGGLPPFLGFFPKWLMINFMIQNNLMFLSFIMIMCSLITLFFYFRLMFSSILMNYPQIMYNKNIKMNFIYFINFFSLIMLIFMNLILI